MAKSKGCFADIRTFVGCYGLLLLTDIMAGTMKKSSLTTIERRFDLPSTITALLASSFQIGNLTMLLFVSYFGSRWHRPRAIFCGAVLLVIGNFIVTLPQFLGGRYAYDDITSNTTSSSQSPECAANITDANAGVNCDEKEPSNQLYILLVVGMMINGVGGTPLQPLGLSYIDDFAHETNSPLYFGVTTSIGLIGPIIGYLAGSAFLKMWVDIGWIDTSAITISPTHPSWVGAWWLGIIVCTTGIAITMIPFLCFPKKMKKQELKSHKENEDTSSIDKSGEEESDDEKKEDEKSKSLLARETKEIKNTIKRMISNKLYLLIVVKFYFANAAMVGIVNFFPKYLEVGFGVSASRANFLTGTINIPCVVVGTLLGSIIMKKYNLSPVGTMKLIVCASVGATCSLAPLLFIGCDTIDIAGVTVPYHNSSQQLPNVESYCNLDCSCASGTYTPVCGSDGVSYVSPCHAGCVGTVFDESGSRQEFTNCACIPIDNDGGMANVSTANPERCEFSKCPDLLTVALAFKSAGSFFAGIASTPLYMFLIRIVDKKDKAIAIGLNLLVLRLLAWIPGPLIYGAAIDSACLYWGQKPCSTRAYCKVYDNSAYRYGFYGIMLTCNIGSCITGFVLYYMTKKAHEKDESKKRQEASKSAVQLQNYDNGAPPAANIEQEALLPDQDEEHRGDPV